MLEAIIAWSLRSRLFVMLLAAVVVIVGFYSLSTLNFDAFPDTTPVQVQINTQAPGLVPEEIEKQITFPVEMAISGLSGLQQVRSVSQFGLSCVIVTFRDGTNVYFARQLINERLGTVELPAGFERPQMGPVATGLGEVFHYLVKSDVKDLSELRTIHDWIIKPQMRTTPGTAEINSWGGFEKQYQIRIDPVRLVKYDVRFQEVLDAVTNNNLNIGGGSINRNDSGERLLVHGVARTVNVEQLERIVIAEKNGIAIRVVDVADVVIGHEIRRGAVTANGQGEAVLGLGFMLMGENSYQVTTAMREKMKDVKTRLPDGVDIDVVYDRTNLVDRVIDTVRKNLFEGALLVVSLLYIFLGNLRAGLIVATAIPMSMLFAFSGMLQAGIAGTLLSLGAIDFGVVVDSSVVVIENIVRRLGHLPPGKDRLAAIRDATIEVRQPTVFGQLIIMIVYIPILTLEGVEGKMFRPMALTVIFVLLGSMICSLTLMPVLASLFLPKNMEEKEPFLVRLARSVYTPILRIVLAAPAITVALGVSALVGVGYLASTMGSEFVPKLSEGAIVIGIIRAPGTDIEEGARLNTLVEKQLVKDFPDEIQACWSRLGVPEIATDASDPEATDLFVILHLPDRWKKAKTQAELVELMEKSISDMPGQIVWFTQPIEQRINEMVSGVRSDIALKLFGNDFETLLGTAQQLEDVLREVPGAVDLATEQVAGQPIVQIKLRQDQLARYGIPARNVLDLVESIGSKPLGTIIEDQYRFPLIIRLPEPYRDNPKTIASLVVPAADGELVPLFRLADIAVVKGPRLIPREWSQRRITIQCNVRGRDVGSFVAEAQRRIAEKVEIPEGYRIQWGGQFENMKRAQQRLMIVVPLALGMIIALLYFSYGNMTDTLLVFLNVPFACLGGILSLYFRDLPISISAAVGFITLAGVSVLNGMVLVSAIRDLQRAGKNRFDSVFGAACERLQTVIMTSLVASIGFLPMAVSTSVGAEVQRPLATVVIGGIISSTIMVLFILPCFYTWVKPFDPQTTDPTGSPQPA
jgi:cobalt-zinc-cadmium resistance protein CzcA